MNDPLFIQESSVSLAEQAYAKLEELLVTNQLRPGQLISESALVVQTGIGRTPVREAIQRLAFQGLITVIPRKGLMVPHVSRREMRSILQTRQALEHLIIAQAVTQATPDQRQALQTLAAHIATVSADLNTFLRLDHRLDELLAHACDNPPAAQAVGPLRTHCRRYWYLNRKRMNISDAVAAHQAMAQSIAQGQEQSAIEACDAIIATMMHLVMQQDLLD